MILFRPTDHCALLQLHDAISSHKRLTNQVAFKKYSILHISIFLDLRKLTEARKTIFINIKKQIKTVRNFLKTEINLLPSSDRKS